MHQTYNAINSQHAVQPTRPSWGGQGGVGMYYYSARYYAPPTFISRDPMFEKYPSISPYTYCSNNPIKRIDPNGKYDYEVDLATKKITRIGEKGSPDKFIIKKENGETITGKEYAAGTIKLREHKNGLQSCKVKGDKNGKEMFEFLAKNTNLEWGHMQTGKGGATSGDNYLFTSYQEDKIQGFSSQVLGINDYIRTYTHYHPNRSSNPSDVDYKMFEAVENHNFYFNKRTSFYIYTPNGNYDPKYNRTIQEIMDDGEKQFFQELFPKPSK